MPKGRGIRAAQAEATRAALVRAARKLFARNGFHATPTMDIVREAGVTRGALQHYFARKEDLFQAVFEQTGREMVREASKRVEVEGWDALLDGFRTFILTLKSLEDYRIAFIDGPAVLGWAEWRRLQADYGLRLMEMGIEDGIAKGRVAKQPTRALAHLILSIIEEASLMVLNADELGVDPEDVAFAMISMLSSIGGQPSD